MSRVRRFLGHPAFRTGVGTGLGYALILLLLLFVVFLVPYAAFSFL